MVLQRLKLIYSLLSLSKVNLQAFLFDTDRGNMKQ
jgi:hypothetical protein